MGKRCLDAPEKHGMSSRMVKKVCQMIDKPFFILTARKFCPASETATFTPVSDLMQRQNPQKGDAF